jgi:ubiquinone/menaquinone biosynthesis C-methylase UbiE
MPWIFFLDDYELGQKTGRYLNQQLPKLELNDLQFELALCSHFLFLYSDHLSLEFHQHALFELARVAKEVRIYPLVTLSNQNSPYLDACMKALIKAGFAVTLEQSQYEFQRGATEMLTIKALT